MSLTADGQHVMCDGEGCAARAPAPVGLRRAPSPNGTGAAPSILGWLFVHGKSGTRHFCPDCMRQRLHSIASENRGRSSLRDG